MNRTGEINYNNFGSKMIISVYRNTRDIDVYFEEYNWTKHSDYKNFKNGSIICPYERRFKGVGYLGEGKYKFRENNKETRCYHEWMKILERGYSKLWKEKHPTYENVYVCEEWHNFQNFAKWYYNNYYSINGERMEIDKDILYKNNKIYSPDTCTIVPQRINNLFVKTNSKRGEFPIGVHRHKNGNYVAQCEFNDSRKRYLGCYSTIEEAFNVYKMEKERYIKQVADEYKSYIPEKLYDAMYKYEVEISD